VDTVREMELGIKKRETRSERREARNEKREARIKRQESRELKVGNGELGNGLESRIYKEYWGDLMLFMPYVEILLVSISVVPMGLCVEFGVFSPEVKTHWLVYRSSRWDSL
jgi:hypothetical protein